MATDFVREAQEALWMGEDNAHKNQGQRKRRLERESCINNVKLNLKDHHHQHQGGSRSGGGQRKPIDNSTYTKSSRRTREPSEKFQRGSLENVSSNPWGDLHFEQQQSSLRRSRSLAISRQDVFADLNLPHVAGQGQGSNKRRSQLIPRAKLIDRSTLSREQRQALRGSSVENLHIEPHNHHRAIIKRKSNNSITPPLDYSPPPQHHHQQQQHYHHHQPLRSHRPTHQPYSSLGNLQQYLPKFIIGEALQQQQESKNDSTYPVSCDDIPGLSLPNYYPDSKYDSTDNTDNVSLSDSFNFSTKKYSSCDNISTSKWTVTESESISYDENIVLSTNRPLYNSLRENHYAKPRTIRGPTPYNNRERNIYFNKDKKSYSSDSSEEKENKEEEDKISLDYFETDSNFDEINLNNATKPPQEDTSPICLEIIEGSESSESLATVVKEPIKTTIEVEQEQSDEYKTIVTVSGDSDDNSGDKQHSHNYLRDILETQKGSKTPLQNFITKKLSNISRKNSKESNLTENQFHSLPDISISKSLKKCEKIDRKLRKCEKITNLKESSTESRFIVNIGKHFDISTNTIPVDFEVKISKVKKNRASVKKTEDLNNNLEVVEVVERTESKLAEVEMDLPEEYQEKLGAMKNYWGKMAGSVSLDEYAPKCKIVDVQTKVEDVKKKFEPPRVDEAKEAEKPNKVQMAKQLFEPPVAKPDKPKTSAFIKESCSYFEQSNQFESLSPSVVEIIAKETPQSNPVKQRKSKSGDVTKRKESSTKSKDKELKNHRAVTKANSSEPEFDHVRYRVVKSDLFQKKIFANCEKESQFDGLMQYLQDYSFQELLIDNNIVIIEPIRSKIPHEASNIAKNAKNITPMVHRDVKTDDSSLRRHFFYHPIRVNKEVNDDELPNPDTVKQVRQFFECGLTRRSQSSQEFNGVEKGIMTPQKADPDKDHCSATDDSNSSHVSDFDSQENLYDTEDYCCEYVSEDILKKIRDCGSTVTYYGGQVVKKQHNQLGLTKVIMEEIKDNEKRTDCTCEDNNKANYQGVKFKLVKSNSCNSRLQLVGTNNIQEAKQKYNKLRQNNLKNVKEEPTSEKNGKHMVNETIKNKMQPKPKIIGEERKLTQWGDVNKTKTFNGISYCDKAIKYDFQIDRKKQALDMEMEFEPYEVAT